MKGFTGPIAPCPVCAQEEDTLEHLPRCAGNSIWQSRIHFHNLLLHDIRDYCTRNRFTTSTVTYSIAYAKACVSTSLPALDIIGGWLGIPTLRFLYFYHPDSVISQVVGKELREVLTRIVAESIKWLKHAWRMRCRSHHAGGTGEDTQSTRSDTTLQLTSFHRMAQGQNMHRSQDDPISSQTSLIPHLSASTSFTELDSELSAVNGTYATSQPEMNISQSHREQVIPGAESSQLPMARDSEPTDDYIERTSPRGPSDALCGNRGRPIRFRITNLRGTLIEGEPLLYDLSDEVAFAAGRTWASLEPHEYYPLYNDIGLLVSGPVEIRIGPSQIPGAGQGLFIYTRHVTFNSGSALGRYWGPSTRNSGIPAIYAPEDAPIPEGTRDDGAYLLRHRNLLVDADEDCSMGYANEGWHDANCFFQHTSHDEPDLLLVLKKKLLPYHVYELTINYGREYWFLGPNPRYLSLSPAARQQCLDYYGG